MRIEKIRATAFGPLVNQSLDFSPGMTVVHGPNEAGKSAWFNATYAALAGRRKGRGRGTAAQGEFRRRHQPWIGSRWAVGGTFVLDNGTVLAVEHNLKTGDTTIADSQTRAPISIAALGKRYGVDLTNDGGFDGARLLGLNRDALRAIAFVAQADVLRVVEDARELQSLLERAASSVTVDVTADAALDELRRLRSERVGVEHVGSRPLRAARQALEATKLSVDNGRDSLQVWVTVLSRERRAAADLRRAEAELAIDERALIWSELVAERSRFASAEDLARQVAERGSVTSVDESRIAQVRSVIAIYDDRGEAPAELAGESAAELRELIAAVPARPTGDLEPRISVVTAHRTLLAAKSAYETHAQGAREPMTGAAVTADPEELRRWAGVMETVVREAEPSVDQELATLLSSHAAAVAANGAAVQQFEADKRRVDQQRDHYAAALASYNQALGTYQRQETEFAAAAQHAQAAQTTAAAAVSEASKMRRTSTILLSSSGGLLLLGAVLALLSPIAGIALLVLGMLVGGAGVTLRPRGTALAVPPVWLPPRPTAPTPPAVPDLTTPEAPTPVIADPRIAELQTRQRLITEQATALRARKQEIAEKCAEIDIAPEPDRLRQFARYLEDAAAAAEREAEFRSRLSQLEDAWRASATALLQRLVEAGEPAASIADDAATASEGSLLALAAYQDHCRARAEQDQLASRLNDLEVRLAERVAAEERLAATATALAERERSVLALHAELFADVAAPADHAAAAKAIHEWLTTADRNRSAADDLRELEARLQQALDGRDLEAWRAELAARETEAGVNPGRTVTDESVQARRAGVDQLRETVGNLRGEAKASAQSGLAVAQAMETEADAERAVARVEALQRCLDIASEQLTKARLESQRTVAPALESLMRPWIPRVTNDRYNDLRIDPESLSMTARDQQGRTSDAQLLSHGTTEQLYVLLRLALTQHLVTSDEICPFVLDDVTAQSDSTRTIGVLEMLQEVSRERQVILFTQEQEVIDWARNQFIDERDSLVEVGGTKGGRP
ncbi:ATP-binding protein [Nocardioides humilatus]|nr:ATP-binding protein [Nocardioides humilatus]